MIRINENGNGGFVAEATVYVIALVRRDTLGFDGYLDVAFHDRHEAEEMAQEKQSGFNDVVYIVQEKELRMEL